MSAGTVSIHSDAGSGIDNGSVSQPSTNNPAIVVSSSSCISKQKIKAVEAKLHKCMDREDSRVKSVRATALHVLESGTIAITPLAQP